MINKRQMPGTETNEQFREQKMNKRFIKSVIATAEKTDVEMPWARGKRRQAFIQKRAEQSELKRKHA